MEVDRVCQLCGKPLPPDKRGAPPRKWCSDNCGKRAWTLRHPPDNRLLPIGPFRKYLEKRRETYESDKGMARALNIPQRVLYRWLHESRFIHLDNVDRVLVDDGTVFLHELYPYEEAA